MRAIGAAFVVAASAMLAGCATHPPTGTLTRQVSPDYTATGPSVARAYVYGTRAVVELDSAASLVFIKDQAGNAIPYEREGRFYRLSRQVDHFTVTVNGGTIAFAPVTVTRVFSAPATQVFSAPAALALPAPAANASPSYRELLQLSTRQLAEVRRFLDANKGKAASQAELASVHQRLDAIEAQVASAAAAVVRISFPTGNTAFRIGREDSRVLLAAAEGAERINVSGYTDARVADPLDAKIAMGRALAALRYLVANGIEPAKIKVFSHPEGHYLTPNKTVQGRAMNRRVEIEVVQSGSTEDIGR